MLKLYYSIASDSGNQQVNPQNSLGGYVSDTEISNGKLDNLFSDISARMLNNEKSEYIGIFIQNSGLTTITGLKLWLDNVSKTNVLQSSFKFGIVVPSQDTEDRYYISNVSDRFSSPYNVEFFSCDGEENELSLPDILAGHYLGIWVKRTPIKANAITEYNNSITKAVGSDTYIQVDLPTEDNILIQFSWD